MKDGLEVNKKLVMDDDLWSFFDNEEKPIWEAIRDNDLDGLKNLHSKDTSTLNNILQSIFFPDIKTNKIFDKCDFISGSKTKVPDSSLYKNMVRLLMLLATTGEHNDIKVQVEQKLLDEMPKLSQLVQDEAGDYPQSTINAAVWMEGAGLRAALQSLLFYYRQIGDVQHQLQTAFYRTKITLSIMGHYKNMVGPDMIETANLYEQIGKPEKTLAFSESVKADLEEDLDWYLEDPEMGLVEDDIDTLKSLKQAYQNIDRLNGTSLYAKRCEQIDDVLKRPIEEDEDDADEEVDD